MYERITCPKCKGYGEVGAGRGPMRETWECPRCRGEGTIKVLVAFPPEADTPFPEEAR